MSGEAIVFSSEALEMGLAVSGGFAVIMVASAAWNTLVAIKEQREQEVAQKLREKKLQTEQWQGFQKAQQLQVDRIIKAQSGVLEDLQQLKLKTNREAEAKPLQEAQHKLAQGFVSVKADYSQWKEDLGHILSFINQSRDTVTENEYAILDKLYAQTQSFIDDCDSSKPPAEELLSSFQLTVEASIENLLQQLDEQHRYNKDILKRCEALLDKVISSEYLTSDEALKKPLNIIQNQLIQFMQAGKISMADISLLESRYDQLHTQIQHSLEQQIVRETLNESVRRNLSGLGYTARSLSDESTTWSIPGGEQVKMVIHKNNQMAFQFMHERDSEEKRAISDQERAFIRQQESRWCSDLKELTKRLVAEGFQYEVRFERESPAESIPIVVVEDVDSILQDSQTRPEARHEKRTLS